MKKITNYLPVLCIVITIILFIALIDTKEANRYFKKFNDYQINVIDIKYIEGNSMTQDRIKELLVLAKNNNIILGKHVYAGDRSKVQNIYLSLDNSQQLYSFLEGNFVIKKINDISSDKNSFVATYKTKDSNQIGLIKDFLQNNFYNYYTFDKFFEENENLYGNYITYYKNSNDFETFFTQASVLLGQDLTSSLLSNNMSNYLFIAIISSIIILMFLYFIFQIYDTYHDSKKIACLKLLGFTNNKITNVLINKRLKIYIIIDIIIIALCGIFIKNITIIHLLLISLILILLLFLTYFLCYICLNIISKGYQISNILKKQNIALKISKVNSIIKVIMTITSILLFTYFVYNVSSLIDNMKLYYNSKNLLDYGIIESFQIDVPILYDYQKHNILYSKIYNDKRLKTLYTEFNAYSATYTEEELKYVIQEYEQGTYFRYASVDINYLKKEKITIYDLNNNKVNVDDIDGVFFLFPKSKINKIEQFDNYYKKYTKEDYEKYNIDYKFQPYIYDDQKLETYSLNLKIKHVDSPILRVIDDSLFLSYIEMRPGLSIFGNGLKTGLKIEIENDKTETFNILKEHIDGSGLGELLTIDNFLTFQEYFTNEITMSRNVTILAIVISIIILTIYSFICFQTVSLYVKSNNQEVLVKYLLGYPKENIFKKIFIDNFKYNIIAFLISLSLLYLIGYFNLLLFISAILIFIAIDLIIIMMTVKFYDFSKICVDLKGGSYD